MWMSEPWCQLLQPGQGRALQPVIPATGGGAGVSAPATGGTCVCGSGTGASHWRQAKVVGQWDAVSATGASGVLAP